MSLIRLLDEKTINQIAAGEVVERPSAVVKELIENALDAGATAITTEIKEGGLSLIRITDNGSGIAKEDIPVAFMRHATSKIKTAEDLFNVTSLGFRGEALSSIAAVSQIELITKETASLNGYRYIIEGGEEKSLEEIGCPAGTTFIIRNLFYNTPARRKFLKSPTTEAGYINDLIERLMVSHPEVSFRFIVNNKVKLQSSGNNNIKDILYHIYGRDISKELLAVEYSSKDVKVSGYIGKPTINRGNRNFENYFINGRYIKNSIITKAIEDAYRPFMMQHKYPFTSLYYEITPSLLDVNVHPQKLELKLTNGDDIYDITYSLIRDILSGKELIPKISLIDEKKKGYNRVGYGSKLPEPFEKNRLSQLEALETMAKKPSAQGQEKAPIDKDLDADRLVKEANAYNSIDKPYLDPSNMGEDISNLNQANMGVDISKPPPANIGEDKSIIDKPSIENKTHEQLALFSDDNTPGMTPFISEQALSSHKIIGQVFSTYWLVEYQKELYIIDQHAAHEKVLYERIITAARDNKHTSQMLMPPIVLTLSISEQEALKTNEEVFKRLGYEVEHFGGNEFSIRAVPADLYKLSDKNLFLEFIDEFTQEIGSRRPNPESILEKTASMACKAAVKANHSFSAEEASSLIKELLSLDNPYHCPHGRPVIVSMSKYELEKRFKRII
ncbi:MAG: DNA mismatch repair endonuclease MutL [Clostridiales bacterium]|nr:DNA mismatch repair endonuclease MutL [Clostridiales bacterium]